MELKLNENESLYTIMYAEYTQLRQEVNNLDDPSMVEECNSIASMFDHTEALNIVGEFYLTSKLSSENRKVLDGLYVLAHTSLLWSDDGEILHFR